MPSAIWSPIGNDRVEEVRGVLKDHGDLAAPNPAHVALRQRQQVAAVQARSRPPTMRPGIGTRRSSDSALTDLPEPDSPTMPMASPSPTSKRDVLDGPDHAALGEETGGQALDVEERRCAHAPSLLQARIERIVEAVGDRRDAERQQADRDAGKGRGPPSLAQVLLRRVQHRSRAHHVGIADAEEARARPRAGWRSRPAASPRRSRGSSRSAGSRATMICDVARPIGARRGDERPLLQRQELGAQEPGDLGPVENADDEDDAPQVGAEDRDDEQAPGRSAASPGRSR